MGLPRNSAELNYKKQQCATQRKFNKRNKAWYIKNLKTIKGINKNKERSDSSAAVKQAYRFCAAE